MEKESQVGTSIKPSNLVQPFSGCDLNFDQPSSVVTAFTFRSPVDWTASRVSMGARRRKRERWPS